MDTFIAVTEIIAGAYLLFFAAGLLGWSSRWVRRRLKARSELASTWPAALDIAAQQGWTVEGGEASRALSGLRLVFSPSIIDGRITGKVSTRFPALPLGSIRSDDGATHQRGLRGVQVEGVELKARLDHPARALIQAIFDDPNVHAQLVDQKLTLTARNGFFDPEEGLLRRALQWAREINHSTLCRSGPVAGQLLELARTDPEPEVVDWALGEAKARQVDVSRLARAGETAYVRLTVAVDLNVADEHLIREALEAANPPWRPILRWLKRYPTHDLVLIVERAALDGADPVACAHVLARLQVGFEELESRAPHARIARFVALAIYQGLSLDAARTLWRGHLSRGALAAREALRQLANHGESADRAPILRFRETEIGRLVRREINAALAGISERQGGQVTVVAEAGRLSEPRVGDLTVVDTTSER